MSAVLRSAARARGAGLVARVVFPYQHHADGGGNVVDKNNNLQVRALHRFNRQPPVTSSSGAVASARANLAYYAPPPSTNVSAAAGASTKYALPRLQHAAGFHISSVTSSSSGDGGAGDGGPQQKRPSSITTSTTTTTASSSASGGGGGKNTSSDYMLFHPQYDLDKIADIKPAHRPPAGFRDWVSFGAVQFARSSFDRITGYGPNKRLTREQWLTRFIFLETVAGVPGMVAAMLRHMVSLRTLKRDHGWIHTLLEEAENERMHLLTFMCLKKPGVGFRLAVLGAQGVFFNAFLAAYIITPRTCHRFVGYLEEEAVKTYTHAIHDIDAAEEGSDAAVWASTPAPEIAVQYWRLPGDATVRDVIVAVRADEASHSHVNHTLGSMATDQANPFQTGHTELPDNFVDPPKGFKPHYDPPPAR